MCKYGGRVKVERKQGGIKEWRLKAAKYKKVKKLIKKVLIFRFSTRL